MNRIEKIETHEIFSLCSLLVAIYIERTPSAKILYKVSSLISIEIYGDINKSGFYSMFNPSNRQRAIEVIILLHSFIEARTGKKIEDWAEVIEALGITDVVEDLTKKLL